MLSDVSLVLDRKRHLGGRPHARSWCSSALGAVPGTLKKPSRFPGTYGAAIFSTVVRVEHELHARSLQLDISTNQGSNLFKYIAMLCAICQLAITLVTLQTGYLEAACACTLGCKQVYDGCVPTLFSHQTTLAAQAPARASKTEGGTCSWCTAHSQPAGPYILCHLQGPDLESRQSTAQARAETACLRLGGVDHDKPTTFPHLGAGGHCKVSASTAHSSMEEGLHLQSQSASGGGVPPPA